MIRFKDKHPVLSYTFILVLTGLMAIPFLGTKIDNSLEVLYQKGSVEDQINQRIKKSFGNIDELVVLAYHSEDLFTKKELQLLTNIQQNIEGIEGIKSCYGLVNTPHFWTTTEDGEQVTNSGEFLYEIPETKKELLRLRESALSNPLFTNNIISPDGKVAGFNIVFKDNLSSGEKERIVKKLTTLYESYNLPDRFHLTGMHVFMEYAGRYIEKDMFKFTSILIVVMFVIITLLFRNVFATIAILATAGICNILTLGTISLLGMRISIATTSIPAIVTALSIAYTLHIFCANKKVMHEVLTSNFLAIVTSMLGFSSMILNPMPTIQQLGIYLTIGSFYSLIVTVYFATPIKNSYFESLSENKVVTSLSLKLYNVVTRYKLFIYAGSIVLILVGINLFRMELDTNYYNYFRSKVKLTKSVDFVNTNLSGQYPVVVTLKNNRGIKEKDTLDLIQRFHLEFEKHPAVNKIISINSILNEGRKAFNDKPDENWMDDLAAVEETQMLVDSEDGRLLSYYLTGNEKETLIFIRSDAISSKLFKLLVTDINLFFEKNKQSETEVLVGGTYLNTVESADRMAKSQLISSFIAISAILIVVFLFVRKFRLMILAGVANLLPVFAIYGVLGLIGEPLNMGTSIIAAIAFGLAVDDTIHFITRYRFNRKKYSKDKAIKEVFHHGVSSITFTSIVIGASFLALSLSSFNPIFQLGIYTSMTIFLCYIIDVLLLPRLLMDFDNEDD